MSSVCAMVPRFGVSADFFHGTGLPPHIGMPSITASALLPPGGKMITSQRDFKSGVFAMSCGLM